MARPLTKCDTHGTPYTRPKDVESEIERALREDRATLTHRLAITDRTSSEYVRSECLVHLVRNAVRRKDEDRQNAVLRILLVRCEAILMAKIPNSIGGACELREEVLSVFSELLASDGKGENPDQLDYYECRFNKAFHALRIDVVRSELRRQKRMVELPNHEDDPDPYNYDEDRFARVFSALRTPPTQDSYIIRRELSEAIYSLPVEERKAIVLCRVLGYKVESSDPTEITVATLCNCTGRTIRNHLSRAAAKLSRFKEDV